MHIRARIDPLIQTTAPARPGARTAWHTHPLGQMLIVTAGNEQLDPERVVAQCAGVAVVYREIAVSPRMLKIVPKSPKAVGLSDGEILHAIEQQNLDAKLRTLLLRFAERKYAIHVPPEEVLASLSPVVRDEEAYRRSFEPDLAMARAARRVVQGANKDQVFSEDLQRYPSITRQLFEQMLMMFNSDEVIDEFLHRDHAAGRGRLLEQARLGIVAQRLSALVAARAREKNQPLDEAEAQFWSDLIKDAGTTVLDSTFRLPSWR